jgi:FAD/FMN-containing dehydrogenase
VTAGGEVVSGLVALLGAERVADDSASLDQYATDTWPLRLVQAAVGGPRTERPLCVIRPTSTSEVSAALRYLDAQRVPVVPRGGGSGVQGGA